jgi:outer membrane protein insertion porin family
MTAGVGVRRTQLRTGSNLSDELSNFIQVHGHQYKEVNFSTAYSYNSLDRYIFPTSGWRQSFSLSATAPGSALQYYRAQYHSHWFRPVGDSLVFGLGGTTGYGSGYGDTRVLPFYENYYVGGARTLRGYEESSLGPRDSLGNPLGGNFMMTGSAQLALQRFGGEPLKSIRPALFIDAGQVYSMAKQTYTVAGHPIAQENPTGLRVSVGGALTWQSPLGPLEFSLGFPLNDKPGDELNPFNFSMGTFF